MQKQPTNFTGCSGNTKQPQLTPPSLPTCILRSICFYVTTIIRGSSTCNIFKKIPQQYSDVAIYINLVYTCTVILNFCNVGCTYFLDDSPVR